MKKIPLETHTFYIAEVYKRKHSKKYNRAMFQGVDLTIGKDLDKAEDLPEFKLPAANQDIAGEALILAMTERVEDKAGIEVFASMDLLDDLCEKDYQVLQEACQKVMSAHVTKKKETKKS